MRDTSRLDVPAKQQPEISTAFVIVLVLMSAIGAALLAIACNVSFNASFGG